MSRHMLCWTRICLARVRAQREENMPEGLNRRNLAGALAVAAATAMLAGAPAKAADPITIGFGMALTGPLAANGKMSLVAMKIWEEDVNAKGGLLGRPVKLIYYDDQSNPSTVPGIYTKLLDVDKVDFAISPYASTQIAPAMPIMRAIQATNADVVVICSYPLDSVGMVKAINEIGFKPKMLGGAMVGLQASVFKTQLGPLLNGIVNYETWIPASTLQFPGSMDLLKKYQARAAAEGVDPLGYYMPVWAYAYLQVLGDAIEATKSTKDDVLADYMRKTTFKTVVGDVKFGDKGEWAEDRMLLVQFQNIKSNSIEEFRNLSTEVIIDPPQYKSGNLIYPYGEAKK